MKAYPDSPAFTEPVFDAFYGPVSRLEDAREYTQFDFEPQLSPNDRYLLFPGVGSYSGPGSGAPPDAENTGMWFVNLETGEIRQLLSRAKPFTWSPPIAIRLPTLMTTPFTRYLLPKVLNLKPSSHILICGICMPVGRQWAAPLPPYPRLREN